MNYVSPPIEQYLKFKNHCSLVTIYDDGEGKRGEGGEEIKEREN